MLECNVNDPLGHFRWGCLTNKSFQITGCEEKGQADHKHCHIYAHKGDDFYSSFKIKSFKRLRFYKNHWPILIIIALVVAEPVFPMKEYSTEKLSNS